MRGKRKKAQVRIGESIAVMIVFFFMLMFGYAFYVKMEQNGMDRTIKANSQQEAVKVGQRIYYISELQCTSGTKIVKEGCFDKIKIEMLIDLLGTNKSITGNPYESVIRSNRDYYFNTLGISKVEFYPLFPTPVAGAYTPVQDLKPDRGDPLYIIYDASDMATNSGMESYETLHMPISLYDPETNRYSFGYLKIMVYYKSIGT